MRERVSILMVIFVEFATSYLYSKPLFRALFPHFKSASRRFPTWLEFHFANSDAHSAWNAHQSPRIGRGDNTDQLSFRSSSVLTALRAPNVRFPTLRHALLLPLLLLLPACLLCQLPYRGRRLPMKYLMQFRFTPFFFKKNFRGRLFFMLLVGIEPRSPTLEA